MLRTTALAVLALAAAAVGAERHPQHDLVTSSHGRDVRATLGTHCTSDEEGTICADYAYPLPTRGSLPVHAGGAIRLKFGEAPREVHAALRSARSGSVAELKAEGSGRKRSLRLPRKLPGAAKRLGVSVRYEKGDADFEVSLKRHRHRHR